VPTYLAQEAPNPPPGPLLIRGRAALQNPAEGCHPSNRLRDMLPLKPRQVVPLVAAAERPSRTRPKRASLETASGLGSPDTPACKCLKASGTRRP
jgi:hypothetical protein